MGVKDLWSILTPHAERKPISVLRGKTVAIDLAGWICESLNVVDYAVHPRQHLKNLFFRTCYLIWEDVIPIFVLEGAAPKLKSHVIEKRNEIQFRGVKPREKPESQEMGDNCRKRFNYVLKQCENLLLAMGIQCVQAPGEAESYCAFLNLKGLVDGVISQDSDCFAYGALRVYRNFSISTQGALTAQGGAVDIYDMNVICSKMDFGQNKVIVMALLCGCDYCPNGIGGVGRDSVLKLFDKYKNNEILKRIRSWRKEHDKYNELEMRVDDKTICSNCGHMGRTQSHTKNGCGICRTNRGCDESLWKEERISLKAELALRKKALADANFPSEDIIEEFLKQPKEAPKLQLNWGQPNMVKFIKQVGPLLQWNEIYCFQKFFPILARWVILNTNRLNKVSLSASCVTPKEILKKRVVKGVPSLELLWEDRKGIFNGLIPDDQLREFSNQNCKGLQDLWTTTEPMEIVELTYPVLVEMFLKSKEKLKNVRTRPRKIKAKLNKNKPRCSLENFSDIIDATNDIEKSLNRDKKTKIRDVSSEKGMQMIDKFFKQKIDSTVEKKKRKTLSERNDMHVKCSTPITKNLPSDLDSEVDENEFDMSDVVNSIVGKSSTSFVLKTHKGRQLCYEAIPQDISILLHESKILTSTSKTCIDDLEILCEKRSLSNPFRKIAYNNAKRMSLDDSFDVLVKMGSNKCIKINDFKAKKTLNIVESFKRKQFPHLNFNEQLSEENISESDDKKSYFFGSDFQQENEDGFQSFMEQNFY